MLQRRKEGKLVSSSLLPSLLFLLCERPECTHTSSRMPHDPDVASRLLVQQSSSSSFDEPLYSCLNV